MKWVDSPRNVARVLRFYRDRDRLMTLGEITRYLDTSYKNVNWVIRNHMSWDEKKSLARLRYQKSKRGNRNPQMGRRGPEAANWIGLCVGKDGYLTVFVNGRRRSLARYVVARSLGIDRLPSWWHVHHISGNIWDNRLANLAIVTNEGHRRLHNLHRWNGRDVRSYQGRRRLDSDVARRLHVSTTSPSRRTRATRHAA